jgi:hypothetical protein
LKRSSIPIEALVFRKELAQNSCRLLSYLIEELAKPDRGRESDELIAIVLQCKLL